MNVQETAIEGVYNTLDTVVLWGVYEDTICFRFNYRLVCFYDVRNAVWAKNRKDLKIDLTNYCIVLQKEIADTGVNQTISIKQSKYNEIYLIRFLFSDDGVAIYATNIVFGVPSYVFTTVRLHR